MLVKGGAPANVACALRKLKIDSVFVGCLGSDEFGKKFIEQFLLLGVNLDFLQLEKNLPTRIVIVDRDNSGDRYFSGFDATPQTIFADEAIKIELDIFNNFAIQVLNKGRDILNVVLSISELDISLMVANQALSRNYICPNILEEKKIAKMLLQIHDELIFECSKKDEKNVKKLIQNAMESVSSSEHHKFSIPLEVGINSGNNWGEAH